jgi:hypothetical protein
VYYQLRMRQAAEALEKALAQPPHASAVQGGEFQLEATRVLWQCVQACWSDGVWVEALAQKFLRLILQLFSRYA